MARLRTFGGLAVLGAFAAAAGCAPPAERHQHAFSGETMGTVYHVSVVTRAPLGDAERAETASAVQAALDRVNALMSTYQPDSELSALNQAAPGQSVPLSSETLEVLALSARVTAETGGAFDVTVGPLVNVYGFGPEGRTQTPADEELQRLLEVVGFEEALAIDAETGVARRTREGVYVDLSAIAKGYAVDQVAEVLEASGYSDYLVEVGGEVRTAGLNQRGGPWRIAIEKPVTERRAIDRIVPLSGLAMATSGDYRNYYEQDGVRISHTIDPRTGRPISHNLASVSVVTQECALADAYATALMTLGADDGMAFAKKRGLAVYMIVHAGDGFETRSTARFEALFGSP
jgi:thiamine biosynthesis lipoprotein